MSQILSLSHSETKKDALLDLQFVNREGFVGVLVQPHPECWKQFWAPPFQSGGRVFECVQRRAAKLVKGLEGVSWEEQLRALGKREAVR